MSGRRAFLCLALVAAIGLLAWSWRSSGIGDTDQDLFTTPASLTSHRLEVLSILVEQLKESTGKYPAGLEAVDVKACRENRRCDGWGCPISYLRTSAGYELRSAGPDGVFGNSDDLIFDGP